MAKAPGKCIFCEAGGLSKEHILPDWLKTLFPRTAESRHTFGIVSPGDLLPVPKITTRDRMGHSGTVKVRVVCEGCNNGWMSELEARAIPILTPLIRGERCRLTPEDQNILAVWAAKTAMTAEYKQRRDDGTTQEERTYLKQQARPPPHWFVWIAGYAGGRWSELVMFQGRGNLQKAPVRRAGDEVHYIQSTTFGMGHVIFRIIGTRCPESETIFGGMDDQRIIRIWPVFPRSTLWPPVSQLNDHDVSMAAHILNRVFDSSLDPLAGWIFRP